MHVDPLGMHANQWRFLSAPGAYVTAACGSGRELARASTQRQFLTAQAILARLNGSYGKQAQRGVLLADDVGVGKTTVAALIAWVFACAGKRVRILAPNEVMARKWVAELHWHVPLLHQCAPALDTAISNVKYGRVTRLRPGQIQVLKHSYTASDAPLDCDLLIVDEAHRAKGEHTGFAKNLKKKGNRFQRVLLLTATPFSIEIVELNRMLDLIGGQSAKPAVRRFSDTLDKLYSGTSASSTEKVATRLVEKAEAAITALGEFLIRHAVDDLTDERDAFGAVMDWDVPVPSANSNEIELLLRMDRCLRPAKLHLPQSVKATNDARFHVGWRHFDHTLKKLNADASVLAQPDRGVIAHQLSVISQLRCHVGVHTKLKAVASAARAVIEQGEKLILFCHHHATAQELTQHLSTALPAVQIQAPDVEVWQAVWEKIIVLVTTDAAPIRNESRLRRNFITWLCSAQIRVQCAVWMSKKAQPSPELAEALRTTSPRHERLSESIADAAQRLYRDLVESPSSRKILSDPGVNFEYLPGGDGNGRVLGVCEPSENPEERLLFIHNRQPDTIISIFNSPFGPDVLIVTDRLSEGIDLHRYCRHLIHYELDPSPIRTVQRNGRLRRVNSWASVTGEPIKVAYPAFGGTRDHRLVQIMKQRVGNFSLLLGGVRDIEGVETTDLDELWRSKVMSSAKLQLKKMGGRLNALDPRISDRTADL